MRMWLFAIDYWVLVYQAKFPGLKSRVNERIKIAPAALLGTLVVNREECIESFERKAIVFSANHFTWASIQTWSRSESFKALKSNNRRMPDVLCIFLHESNIFFSRGVLTIKCGFDNFSEFHRGFVVTLRKLIREWVGHLQSCTVGYNGKS